MAHSPPPRRPERRPPILLAVLLLAVGAALAVGGRGQVLAASGGMAAAPVLAQNPPATPLTITKTSTPNPVVTGSTLTYTVRATNTAASWATNIVLVDSTNGLTNLVLTADVGTCASSQNVVTCNAPALSPGQTMTVTIRGTVTAPAGTTLNNTASVSGAVERNTYTATVTNTTLVGSGSGLPDLTVSINAPATASTSAGYQYTLTVTNIGGSNVTGLVVVSNLTAGVGFVSAAGSSGFQCAQAGGVVTCNQGTISAGGNATITINVTAPAIAGTVVNSAVVDPNNAIAESNEGNNTAAANTIVSAPPPGAGTLTITKVASPNPVTPGSTLTHTVTVANTSAASALNVSVVDGTQGLNAAQVNATIAGQAFNGCTVQASQVTCFTPGMAPGAILVVTITGQVVAAAGSSITNTATVSGSINRANVSNSSTVIVNVAPDVDLVGTKTAAPNPVAAGAPLVFTINVTNTGVSTANNVVVRDPLPAGVIFGTAAGTNGFTCTAAGQVVTCTGGTIASGATATITINTTAPQTTGSIVNTATFDPNNAIAESDETNNTASVTVNVGTGIDLIVSKADSPDPVVPLGTLTYTLTVTNQGTQNTAQNVVVRDVLPTGANAVTFVSAVGTNGFNCVHQPGPGTVVCNNGQIPFGTSATITIVVQAPAQTGVTITNQAIVDPDNIIAELNENNNTDTETTNVTAILDLTVSKADAPDPVAPGQTLTYTITVTKTGADPVNNVRVLDSLPPGVTFVSGVGTNNFTCINNANSVDCTGGQFAAGTQVATITITTTVTAPAGTVLTNQVVVDPDNNIVESNENNNTASSTTNVVPNIELNVSKTVSPNPVAPSGVLTYTITVNNTGTAQATGVKVTDVLPQAVGFTPPVPTSALGTNQFTCTYTAANNQVNCTGGVIPGGGSATITIVVEAPAQPAVYTNQVVVDPDNTVIEIDENNNTASVQVTVAIGGGGAFVDLSVAKTCTAQVVPGGQVTCPITITNNGSAVAFNVMLRDVLPAGTTFVSALDAVPGVNAFACGQLNGQVDCIVGSLPAGASRTINLIFNAPNVNNITITNQAAADPVNLIAEANETNNTATASTLVLAALDLTITKTSAPVGIVPPGGNLVYTITVTANGAAANNVDVRDTLPIGFNLVTIAVSAGSNFQCNALNGVVNCTGGTLASGGSANIILTGTVNAPNNTVLTNTVVVDPNNTHVESNENNNTASVVVVVTPNIDLTVAKTGPANVTPNVDFNYTINLSNNGSVAATNVTVTDTMPVGVQLVTVNPSAGSGFACAINNQTNVITCTGGTVPVGANTASITVTARTNLPTGTQITNVSVVDPNNAIQEISETNNSFTLQLQVIANIDLTVTKTGPVQVATGGIFTYTINATNNGTAAATGVVVRDALPVGIVVQSVNPQLGSNFLCNVIQGNNTINCTGGTIAAGATQTITVTALVTAQPSPPVLSNVVRIDPDNAIPETDETNNTFQLDITVIPAPDLTVTKVPDAPTKNTGDALTWTITVTAANNAGNTINGIVVRDDAPAGFSINAGGIVTTNGFACVVAAQTVTCSGGSITGNTSATITIPGTVTAAPGTVLVNTVTVDPNNTIVESNENNNQSSASVNVVSAIDLTIAKTGPANVAQAGTITYTLTVTNNGTQTANGIVVRDTHPVGVTVTNVTSTPAGANFACQVGPQNVVNCTNGTLAPAGVATITVTAQVAANVPVGTVLDNVAVVDPDNTIPEILENNNTATFTLTVVGALDLQIAKAGPVNVPQGGTVTYTLTVTNAGPGAASGIVVRDTHPQSVTVTNVTYTPAGANFACQVGPQNVVNCTGGTLAAAGVATITITATVAQNVPVGTELQNVAVVDPNNAIAESDETNNTANFSLTVIAAANLTIQKTASVTNVPTGGNVTYTITVSTDSAVAIPGVVVSDVLPVGFTTVIGNITVVQGGFTCSLVAQTVTCTGGSVVAGTPGIITILGTVTAPAGSTLVNTAVVDPNNTIAESNENDNSSTVTVQVTAAVDLSVIKTGPAAIAPGGTITYTLTVSNLLGTQAATGVVVRDTHPVGITITNVTASAGSNFACQVGPANIVNCTNGTIAAGGAATITITAVAAANLTNGQVLQNVAVADPDNTIPEIDENNNTANFDITVTIGIDLSVTLATMGTSGTFGTPDPTGPLAPNSPQGFGIPVSNGGASAASNVRVDINIPNGFTVSTVGSSPGSGFLCQLNGGLLVCTGGTIAAGGTVIIFVEGTVGNPPTGILDFAATVDPQNAIAEILETNNTDNRFYLIASAINLTAVNNAVTLPATMQPGQSGQYAVDLSNTGTATATNVTFQAFISPFFTGNPLILPAGSGFACNTAVGVVTCTGGTILAGQTFTFNFNGGVIPNPPPGSTLQFTTIIDPANAIVEISEGDNSDSLQVDIGTLGFVDLITSITCPGCPPQPSILGGGLVSYRVTFTNTGTAFANNVLDRITIDPQLTVLAVTPSVGTQCQLFQNPVNRIDCRANLGAGGFATVDILALISSPATVPGSILSADSRVDPLGVIPEIDETNNNAQLLLTVLP